MAQALNPGFQVTATVVFTDGATPPNVVTLPTPPVWATDNSAATSVVAAADGLSAVITYIAPGVSNITVTGTNADGTTDVLTGEVDTVDDATGGTMTFGTPVPVGATPPTTITGSVAAVAHPMSLGAARTPTPNK